MTGEISIKLYKNCFAFFLNTTLLPFLLFILDWLNPGQDDIIRDILSLFFISNFISPYMGLILQPESLTSKYRRKKITKQGERSITTQTQANKIFQKIDFNLGDRYAFISQLVLNCMFYAAIFPIGILVTILGLIITYWSSKKWILNYCCVPKFSFKLGARINVITCFFPTVYAIGYAANLYMVKKDVEFDRSYSIYIAAATIPISLLFVFFGQKLAKKCLTKTKASMISRGSRKIKNQLSYKALNPTSFIHHDLSASTQINQNMWSKLVSYVAARQSGLKITQSDDKNVQIQEDGDISFSSGYQEPSERERRLSQLND